MSDGRTAALHTRDQYERKDRTEKLQEQQQDHYWDLFIHL